MPRVKVPVPAEDKPKPAEKPQEPVVTEPPAPAPEAPQQQRKGLSGQHIIYIAFGIILLIMLGVIINLAKSNNDDKSGSSTSNSGEIKEITGYVGKFYILPTGETPTIATVTNASKVQNQPFFKNAQNGDKVLLYTKSGLAILYRPSVKKVVNVASVNLNNSSTSATPTDASSVTGGQ